MTVGVTAEPAGWEGLRFLTASVLPLRRACNLRCLFCFSASSVSWEAREQEDLRDYDLEAYFGDAWARGARRLVITGGGEPLLRPEVVLEVIRRGRGTFEEVACFTNGTFLTRELAEALAEAGLSHLCWSRHAVDDGANRRLMGEGAPGLAAFMEAAAPLRVRATCVMTRGYVDSAEAARAYVAALAPRGVEEFTFKHTYVAYPSSVYGDSDENHWARRHQVELDPFEDQGEVVGTLPWGPKIRRWEGVQVCHYREPSPAWELASGIGRSLNLMSDGTVYASLEEQQSRLYRLSACSRR